MADLLRSGRAAPAEDAEIVLGVLSAIERDNNITQRSVARELGIALGLANAYLKRCVRKGLVKVRQAPAKRYAYYLTPKGFGEKSRLTAEYLSYSFAFFRNARSQLSGLMALAVARRQYRMLLIGSSDLAEIATLCARDHGIEIVGVVDAKRRSGRFSGFPVFDSIDAAGPFDVAVITDMSTPQRAYERAVALLGRGCVLVPPLLRVRVDRPDA